MKLELNKEEIERIIADRFGVPVENVQAGTLKVIKGHGMAEHQDHEPIAVVTKPLEETQL